MPNNITVLYVEDEQETMDLTLETLQNIFDTIITAKDGEEALELFKTNDIDIVLSDLNLPKMNGLELSKSLKELKPSLPIIIVSAYSNEKFLLESIKLKIDGYILKPVDVGLLTETMQEHKTKIEYIKESKKYKKLLKEYKNAMDYSSIISKTDSKGIITYVNDAFCNISGYTKEELIGKNHNIIRDPDTPSSTFEELWSKINNKTPWNGVIKNKKKNGNSYFVKTTITPILNHNDNIVEFIAIREDITELELYRQDLEKQLKITTQEIIETQKEVVFTMGAIGETRSKETGLHVKRVAEYSYFLAKKSGLSEKEAVLLKQASPMHDIGKVGIPDDVLNKPGKLTPEEFEIMKTHSELGYEMLKHSTRDILKAASIIAHQHHEKWDGTGYPNNLKGEDIHIFGRITAIVDVFDALGHDRVYKKAWEMNAILDLLQENRGKAFDPKLIDIFFENFDEIMELKKRFDN